MKLLARANKIYNREIYGKSSSFSPHQICVSDRVALFSGKGVSRWIVDRLDAKEPSVILSHENISVVSIFRSTDLRIIGCPCKL